MDISLSSPEIFLPSAHSHSSPLHHTEPPRAKPPHSSTTDSATCLSSTHSNYSIPKTNNMITLIVNCQSVKNKTAELALITDLQKYSLAFLKAQFSDLYTSYVTLMSFHRQCLLKFRCSLMTAYFIDRYAPRTTTKCYNATYMP